MIKITIAKIPKNYPANHNGILSFKSHCFMSRLRQTNWRYVSVVLHVPFQLQQSNVIIKSNAIELWMRSDFHHLKFTSRIKNALQQHPISASMQRPNILKESLLSYSIRLWSRGVVCACQVVISQPHSKLSRAEPMLIVKKQKAIFYMVFTENLAPIKKPVFS